MKIKKGTNDQSETEAILTIDVAPTILASMGESLNSNSQGIVNLGLLQALGQSDVQLSALLVYNNVYQLLSLFSSRMQTFYFLDPVLASMEESIA